MESTQPKWAVLDEMVHVKLHNLLKTYLPTNSNCSSNSNQCSLCNIELPNTDDKELTATDKDKQLLLFKFYQTFNLEFPNGIAAGIQYCESCNNQLIRMQELELKVQELNQLIEEIQDNLMIVLVKSRVDKDSFVVEEDGSGSDDGDEVVTDVSLPQFIKDMRKCRQSCHCQCQDLPRNQAQENGIPKIKRESRIRSQSQDRPLATIEPVNSQEQEINEVHGPDLKNLIEDIQTEDLYPDPDVELEIKLEPIDVDDIGYDLALFHNDLGFNSDSSSSEYSPKKETARRIRIRRRIRARQNQKVSQAKGKIPRRNNLRKKANAKPKRRFASRSPVLRKKSLMEKGNSDPTAREPMECVYGCKMRPFITNRGQNKHHYTCHKKMHLKLNPFCCGLCFEIFDTDGLLKGHKCKYQKHKPPRPPPKISCKDKDRKFTCEVCGKVYATSDNFNNHMYEHEPSKTGFPCKICGVLFDKPLQAERHLRMVHGNGKDVEYRNRCCPHCGKHTRNVKFYRLHLYKQHKEEYMKDKPFYCKVCHHVFKTQQELDTDFQRHLKCQYCEYRFTDKHMLSEHENTHTGLQPHQCTICGKRFKQFANMSQHMKIHTGERPYHCEICPERLGFFRIRDLDRHNKKCHSLLQT